MAFHHRGSSKVFGVHGCTGPTGCLTNLRAERPLRWGLIGPFEAYRRRGRSDREAVALRFWRRRSGSASAGNESRRQTLGLRAREARRAVLPMALRRGLLKTEPRPHGEVGPPFEWLLEEPLGHVRPPWDTRGREVHHVRREALGSSVALRGATVGLHGRKGDTSMSPFAPLRFRGRWTFSIARQGETRASHAPAWTASTHCTVVS